MCGSFTLNAGTFTYDPFVGVGFNITGNDQTPADISDLEGVCIAYTASVTPTLELGLGEDQEIGYDNPFKSLAKSTAGTVAKIAHCNNAQLTF